MHKAVASIRGLHPDRFGILLDIFKEDLNPGTSSHYGVGDGNSAMCHALCFTTAPDSCLDVLKLEQWAAEAAQRIWRSADQFCHVTVDMEYTPDGWANGAATANFRFAFNEAEYRRVERLNRDREAEEAAKAAVPVQPPPLATVQSFVRSVEDLTVEDLCGIVGYVRDLLWRDPDGEWDADMTDAIAKKLQVYGLHEKRVESKEAALLRRLWNAVQENEIAGYVGLELCHDVADALGDAADKKA